MKEMMGPIKTDGKIIPRGYGSISHLPGSKMINDRDKLIGEQEIHLLCHRRRSVNDLVIVTEKVDGMNASVLRKDNHLYPIIRSGYDARSSDIGWIRAFGYFVEINSSRFMDVLLDGERLCGEWLIKTHTLSYDLPHEPFAVFDIIDEDHVRLPYGEFRHRIDKVFTPTGLIHLGEAIPPHRAVALCGKGYHGVVGRKPEGVVYRYECNGAFSFSGKYVSHPDAGNEELFKNNISQNTLNGMRSKYKKLYIDYTTGQARES